MRFTVTTSVEDVSALIDRFAAEDKTNASSAVRLHKELDRVIAAIAEEKDAKKIIKVIEKFKSGVKDHRVEADEIVRTTLLRDADALIVGWGGTPRTLTARPFRMPGDPGIRKGRFVYVGLEVGAWRCGWFR